MGALLYVFICVLYIYMCVCIICVIFGFGVVFVHHCGWYLQEKGHYIGIDCVLLSNYIPSHLTGGGESFASV